MVDDATLRKKGYDDAVLAAYNKLTKASGSEIPRYRYPEHTIKQSFSLPSLRTQFDRPVSEHIETSEKVAQSFGNAPPPPIDQKQGVTPYTIFEDPNKEKDKALRERLATLLRKSSTDFVIYAKTTTTTFDKANIDNPKDPEYTTGTETLTSYIVVPKSGKPLTELKPIAIMETGESKTPDGLLRGTHIAISTKPDTYFLTLTSPKGQETHMGLTLEQNNSLTVKTKDADGKIIKNLSDEQLRALGTGNAKLDPNTLEFIPPPQPPMKSTAIPSPSTLTNAVAKIEEMYGLRSPNAHNEGANTPGLATTIPFARGPSNERTV